MVKRTSLLEEIGEYEEGKMPPEKTYVTEDEVKKKIPVHKAIQLAQQAYIKLSTGQALNPERAILTTREGTSLYCMPSHVTGLKTITVKIARFNPNNPERGLPSVMAKVHMYDASTGSEMAEVEAENLTVLRTAASSAVATNLLARHDSTTLGIFGTGRQAEGHIPAIREVRDIQQVIVYSRNMASREAFARKAARTYEIGVKAASSPEEVLADSDILVLATNSKTPLFPGELVKPRSHVNATGSSLPDAREVDTALVKRSTITVDFKPQALKTYGDILIPLREKAIRETDISEIGELLVHSKLREKTGDKITLFKSGGVAVLDAVFAEYLLSPWHKAETWQDIVEEKNRSF